MLVAMKKPATDQRKSERRRTAVAIVCQPYSSSRAERTVDGVMRNLSNGGFYMETRHPFKNGSILIVRTRGGPPEPSWRVESPRPRSISLAEIRWRRELAEDAEVRYGLGLRYLD